MRIEASNGIAIGEGANAPTPAKIAHAARELESQFAQMLVKSMRATAPGDPLAGDGTWRDMQDQQLAKSLVQGRGLGLAPVIERQLRRDNGLSDTHVPLDTTLPRARTQSPMALPASLPMSLPLRTTGGDGAMPLATGGGLALASTRSGVSLPAMSMPSMPASDAWTPQADPSFDTSTAGDADGSSPEAFVRSIWPHAQKAAAELGVPARALVAQAALETGWGRRLAGGDSHNLFGIKAGGRWKGEAVESGTHEYVGGVRRNERAAFRAYGSTAESFADYTRLIGNDRYTAARGTGDDVHRFASALQKAGYATDPRYAAKLTAIAHGDTIDRALSGMPGGMPAQRDTRVAVATPAAAPAIAKTTAAAPVEYTTDIGANQAVADARRASAAVATYTSLAAGVAGPRL